MGIQPIYATGTATVTADSDVVTGVNTAWGLALINGGTFSAKGRSIPIVAVTDDTHLTLAYPAPADMAGAGQRYAVELGRADVADTIVANRKLADLIDILSNKITPLGRALLDDATDAAMRTTIGAQANLGLAPADVSDYARGLLNDADAGAARETLGIGWEKIRRERVGNVASVRFTGLSGYSRLRLSGRIRMSDLDAYPTLQAVNGTIVDAGATAYRGAGTSDLALSSETGRMDHFGPLQEPGIRVAPGGMSNDERDALIFNLDIARWDDPTEFSAFVTGSYLDRYASRYSYALRWNYVGGGHDGLYLAAWPSGLMSVDLLLEGLRA